MLIAPLNESVVVFTVRLNLRFMTLQQRYVIEILRKYFSNIGIGLFSWRIKSNYFWDGAGRKVRVFHHGLEEI